MVQASPYCKSSTDDETEDAIVRATARIGRLVEILEAADAAQELERRARMGAEDVVRIGKLVVPKGHRGQAAVNDWIAAMMSIYKQITGKDPGVSVWQAWAGQSRWSAHSFFASVRETNRYSAFTWFSCRPNQGHSNGRTAPTKIDSIEPYRGRPP